METNNAFDELIETIKKSDIYNDYQHILNQVKANDDINRTIKNIKELQKKLVKEKYTKGPDIKTLEHNLEEQKTYLYSIPLYQDYICKSDELNDLVKIITNKIQIYLNSINI